MADNKPVFFKGTAVGQLEVHVEQYLAGHHVAVARLDGKRIGSGSIGRLQQPKQSPKGLVTHYIIGTKPAVGLLAPEAEIIQVAIDAADRAWQQSSAGVASALRAERERLVAAWRGAIEDAGEHFERAQAAEDVNAWNIKAEWERKVDEALQALRAFDAEHPEVKAAIKVETAESVERNRWQ